MKKVFIIISMISIFGLRTNAQFTKLFDFNGYTNGSNPRGSLFFDGTFLYGMTYNGGINSKGAIFKIKPDGSGYVKLLDFAGPPNGYWPYGSLISDGTFLYGMTLNGGVNNHGIIFKIKHDGTGYVKLFDFAGYPIDGSGPQGSLISDGTFLYGMTGSGGTNDNGTIFKIKPDGSGYVKLLDFVDTISGSYPSGSLIFDGNFLYGMTYDGGINSVGVIFKIQSDGTGYVKLFDFAGYNGSSPHGSLIYDGTFLYGMTYIGGTYGKGTLFKIQPDGNGYVRLLDFSGTINGSKPYGSLIYDNNNIYGMTEYGGAYNYGVIFKFGITTDIEEIYENKNITVYPNPANNELNISCNNTQFNIYNFNILDITGKQIKNINCKKQSQSYNIDIADLSAGLYILMLKGDNGTESSKFVKK